MIAVTLGQGGLAGQGKSPGTRAKQIAMLRAELIKAQENAKKSRIAEGFEIGHLGKSHQGRSSDARHGAQSAGYFDGFENCEGIQFENHSRRRKRSTAFAE
ncbi:amidohydrolase [Biomphalaria pfeifferi]|uniref:Amidohydrolase n=1 Tax=Biomphalaria pfeifferi TaxID=112525 RepID=A0AAD8AN92_BIOPF|nr:amidohydrolase [Biomphalaria pfeifferi]